MKSSGIIVLIIPKMKSFNVRRVVLMCIAITANLYSGNASHLCPPPLNPTLPLLDTNIIKLNLNRVPTGILDDFANTPVDPTPFDGVLRDTNYVNFPTLNALLSGMSSSVVNNQSIPSDITQQMSDIYRTTGYNPVGIIAYEYNRTKKDALKDHLIELDEDTGQYHDVYNGNEWVNPYDDKYLVAFSPYMNISGRTVTYHFADSLIFSNLDILHIKFYPVSASSSFVYVTSGTHTVPHTYSSGTVADAKLEIILTDNTVLRTHSRITLLSAPSTSPRMTITPDDTTLTFQCDSVYMGYNKTVKARMSVKYANGVSLTKPLIVAEGFEPFSDLDGLLFDSDKSGRGAQYIDIFDTYDDFEKRFEWSQHYGYDIVYIDWLDSCAPIQSNADILIKVIQWVNNNNTSSEKSVLLGQSMGGLIARYALRKMETAWPVPIPHNVKMYVSHDSPHFGVNVPVGAVYAAQKILDSAPSFFIVAMRDIISAIIRATKGDTYNHLSTYISELVAMRSAPSVKQMLMHYVDANFQYNSAIHNEFYNQLETLGFPHGDAGVGILNLSLSNGGVNSYMNNLDTLIHVDALAYTGLLFPILGWAQFLIDGNVLSGIISSLLVYSGPRIVMNVYPNTPGTTKVFDYSFSWRKSYGILEGKEIVLSTDSFNAPPASSAYDDDYGSYFKLRNSAYNEVFQDHDDFLGGYYARINLRTKFMFVPTVSSLAYKKHRSLISEFDRKIDFANAGIDMSKIPFDGYRFSHSTPPLESTKHITNTIADIEWINAVSQLSISAPADTLISGNQFQIDGGDSSMSVVWSVTDEDVATINSATGELTRQLGGSTTVIADIQYKGGDLRLSRDFYMEEDLFPGFPSFVLSQDTGHISGNGFDGRYFITATSSFSIPTIFKEFMECHWGVKENLNSTIQWSTQTYVDFHNMNVFECVFPSSANARRVYFYVTYKNQTSPTYSVLCTLPLIPMNGLLMLDDDGGLYVEGMDEPFAQVKGDINDETYYFTCADKTLLYHVWPTWAQFCTDMLESEEFVALLKTLKPWGSDDVIMIPYSFHTDSSSEAINSFITVKYDETL